MRKVIAVHRENDPTGEVMIFQMNLSALELDDGEIVYISNQLLDEVTL